MKKIVIVSSIVLALVLALGIAAPILAADPGGTLPAAVQGAGKIGRAIILAKLLLIQDEARVAALLDKAVTNGKITTEQAEKIYAYWTLHHEKFTRRVVLRGLNRIQDEAKLQERLDKAVASGRITAEQEAKIIEAWHKLHDK